MVTPPLRRQFLVVPVPSAAGERFGILRRETLELIPQWPTSHEQVQGTLAELLAKSTPLTELATRTELCAAGLPQDDVDDLIQRARAIREDVEEFRWEATTSVGYRNAYGQEVVAKTHGHGSGPYERVFVLRCGACQNEYEIEGSYIHRSTCPRCLSTRE